MEQEKSGEGSSASITPAIDVDQPAVSIEPAMEDIVSSSMPQVDGGALKRDEFKPATAYKGVVYGYDGVVIAQVTDRYV